MQLGNHVPLFSLQVHSNIYFPFFNVNFIYCMLKLISIYVNINSICYKRKLHILQCTRALSEPQSINSIISLFQQSRSTHHSSHIRM